jgi:hypothetical protein
MFTTKTAVCLALILTALAPATLAQVVETTLAESFEDGSNQGGWRWFSSNGPPLLFEIGGNPGAYLTATQYTSPGASIRTTEAGSPFTGDWRAAGMTSIGVDFASFLLQEDIGNPEFDAYRFTVFIGNDAGTPGNFWDDTSYYFKTDEFLPLVGEGWLSYDIAMPSQADAVPAGWQHYVWPPEPEPMSWPELMSDVSYTWLMYNDPNGFYIFANWILGADNVRVTTISGNAFVDLGSGLAGTYGEPVLAASSLFVEGADITVDLSNMLENAPLFLAVGFSAVNLPLHGGTLVPDVSSLGLLLGLGTGPSGALQLVADTPPGVPSGLELYVQGWVKDPGGVSGFAATNAVQATAP